MSVLDRIRNCELYVNVFKIVKHDLPCHMVNETAELLTLAERGERMRWIPCSERFPEVGQNVLANRIFTHGITGYQILRFGKLQNTPHWFYQDSYLSLNAVTHWMPLPESPAENDSPDETAESTKPDKPNMKEVAYNFFDLSWVRRTEILNKLNLLDEEDKGKNHVYILEKIMAKVKQRNCMDALWQEIKLAKGNNEPSENDRTGELPKVNVASKWLASRFEAVK